MFQMPMVLNLAQRISLQYIIQSFKEVQKGLESQCTTSRLLCNTSLVEVVLRHVHTIYNLLRVEDN
jgi:hypothetical protein